VLPIKSNGATHNPKVMLYPADGADTDLMLWPAPLHFGLVASQHCAIGEENQLSFKP
jgi:hypothetical protein